MTRFTFDMADETDYVNRGRWLVDQNNTSESQKGLEEKDANVPPQLSC